MKDTLVFLTGKGQKNRKARLIEGLRRLSAGYLREVLVMEEALAYAQSKKRAKKRSDESGPCHGAGSAI
jgi:hypothetical protein